jgi:hypothetical protein
MILWIATAIVFKKQKDKKSLALSFFSSKVESSPQKTTL